MKRSALKPGKPLPRKTSLKGTAFKRADRKELGAVRKVRMKSRGPKMTPIRKSARGQECTMQIPGVCNRNPETTVLCHSNSLADGKGMGLKTPDSAAAFGCSCCHDVLDGRRPRPNEMTLADIDAFFRAGVKRTHEILARMGLLQQQGD